LLLTDAVLINVSFLLSFLIRYGLPLPQRNFDPYRKSLLFLTVIYVSTLVVFKVYRQRFPSSWELFKRVFCGLFIGTLLSVAFVYVFRIEWGAFPTSIFVTSFFINLLLVFKVNQIILKLRKRIRKKVVLIGQGCVNGIVTRKADVQRKRIDQIAELLEYHDLDEIVICDKIQDGQNLNLLIYLLQKLKVNVVFSPVTYLALLPERINGNNSFKFLSTFVGRTPDVEEFLMRALDIIGSVLLLVTSLPATALISFLIKVSSPGPILYKQQRVGKDGRIFILYKFRTMGKDAEKESGFAPATRNDPRVTGLGRWLRRTRLDELPQLLNVLRGEMSLVGPRPENLYRVEIHKSLQGLRLAVRPGITGLAQIRSFYDLKPKQKIRYDYLYIQQRSLLLNVYILAKTIPVLFSKKGW
jgi:lipopolysaccharide/colanic/teichoic acid biosynthesis glycosyltransferase